MTAITFYDARCEPAINATASAAIDMVNTLHRENDRPSYDLSEILFGSAA